MEADLSRTSAVYAQLDKSAGSRSGTGRKLDNITKPEVPKVGARCQIRKIFKSSDRKENIRGTSGPNDQEEFLGTLGM